MIRQFRRTALAAALAASLAVALAVAPAADAARTATSTRGLHASLAGGLHHRTATTSYGAGYFLYPSDGIASITATFTMPTFSCAHSTDQEWLLPGIWVYSSGALTQQVDVNFNCNSGTLYQSSVICLAGTCSGSPIAVAPGDVIRTSLSYTPTATTGTVRDLTAGTVSQLTAAAITTDNVAFVGEIGPSLFLGGTVTHVPTFTTLKFSQVAFNGERLVDGPTPTRYNLATTARVQITASAITADGEGFTTTFKKN